MIIAFSTSSPEASVALISGVDVLFSASEPANRQAGEVCLRLLEAGLRETGRELRAATIFAADLGPGSFTGVRVGIVLAKSFAFAQGVPCIGASSFDLIMRGGSAFVPTRKGEFWLREPGQESRRTHELPQTSVGYGAEDRPSQFPGAERLAEFWSELPLLAAEALLPEYMAEPNISTPKKPYKTSAGALNAS